MKLSTRSRYGARAMLEMAMNFNNGPIVVGEIARRQGISRGYLEHLIVSLQSAGLVETFRGAKGGCRLTRHPSEIRLGDVVQALEGSLTPVDCGDCERKGMCVTRDIWCRMGDAITNTLNSVTLADMVKLQEEKSSDSQGPMYCI